MKKDPYGFWIVLYGARYSAEHNPCVFPTDVSHVFFVLDTPNPERKVVLRHEARARRVIGEERQINFGCNDSERVESNTAGPNQIGEELLDGGEVDQVLASVIHALDAQTLAAEDDSHYDDVEYKEDAKEPY